MRPPVPRRPHAPQVYRVRRAIAATGVLLVLVLGWKAVGPGGGGEEAATTTSSSTTTTLPALPACTTDPEIILGNNPATEWATILVDTQRAIPAAYGPSDLHNIADAGFPLTDGVTVRNIVIKDLRGLRLAAEAAGTPIRVIVGYRSYQYQQDLLERRITEMGASEAGSRVAKPGHSEHQLGTTIDVTSANLTDVTDTWGTTPAGEWIAAHASEHGFVLSYPKGNNSGSTCYDYEPWHLRYVGCAIAAEVKAQGITLRQYLWNLEASGSAPPPPVDCATVAPTTTTTVSSGLGSTSSTSSSSTSTTAKTGTR